MQAPEGWLQFRIGSCQYALPVGSVVQVVGLEALRPAGEAGWAGLLRVRGGVLPLADGAVVVDEPAPPCRGRGLVLRGSPPLGLIVDQVDGLVGAAALPLADRGDLSPLAVASLNAPGGPTLVLDPEPLWQQLRAGLEQRRDGHGYRLLALEREGGRRGRTPPRAVEPVQAQPALEAPPVAAPRPAVQVAPVAAGRPVVEAAPVAEAGPSESAGRAARSPGLEFSGQVVVFRAGLRFDLGVPAESVVEVGPAVQARPLRGGPTHLAGLVSWRGRRVPLLDLPARLGVAEHLAGPRQTLYLGLAGRAVRALAVSVGEVAGTAQVPALQREVRPPNLPAEWPLGAARLDGRVLIVLNPTTLVMA